MRSKQAEKKMYEEIMAENSLNFVSISVDSRSSKNSKQDKLKENHVHIIIKLVKTTYKKIWKAAS